MTFDYERDIDRDAAKTEVRDWYNDILAQSGRDYDAFDSTAENFGFVRTVRELKNVSRCAQEKDDAYWAKRVAQGGARA